MNFPFTTKKLFLHEIKHNCHNTTVIYEKGNILLIKVCSFYDCHHLFDYKDINWCVAHNSYHWNEYVGSPDCKQFFIIDFDNINNKSNTKEYNLSLIGFTYKKDELYAAHARNDAPLKKAFKDIIKEKGLYELFYKKEKLNSSMILIAIGIVAFVIFMAYLVLTH